MSPSYDFETMTLQEFAALQQHIQQVIKKRFEQRIALVFTDVVGSTAYFEHYGDAAGRALIERHHALLAEALAPVQGRVVDTAGDGAFVVVSDVPKAAQALIAFQQAIAQDNASMPKHEALKVRTGLHWGAALVDRDVVSGDAVNFAARIANTAEAAEIRLSTEAFGQLPPQLRLRCRTLPELKLKGYPHPVRPISLDWRDPTKIPTRIFIAETGQRLPLPLKDTISMGRLATHDGRAANDIVLHHPDPTASSRISRWHLQLERSGDALRMRQLSRGLTEIDGLRVIRNGVVDVRPGTEVRVAGVLTIRFEGASTASAENRYTRFED